MNAQELIAESRKLAKEQQAAEAAKTTDTSATRAGVSQFLSTATGGFGDYMELLTRKMRGDDTSGGIDQVRADMAKLHEAHPGAALTGKIAGTAAQALPVGRALQGAGWLAKAPGIVGGLKSGAQIGAGVGAVNEAARQIDRFGSTERAEEDFNPLTSAARIGKEALFGGIGGGVGGGVGNLATKGAGLVANRIPAPLSEAAIQATLQAQRVLERAGLRGAAKPAPHEAMRTVADPTLRAELAEGASGLEGLVVKAGRDFQTVGAPKGQGMIPAEVATKAAREAARQQTSAAATSAGDAAARAAEIAAKAQATRAALPTNVPLNTAAEWNILGDPALKALRDSTVRNMRQQISDVLKVGPTPRPSVQGVPYRAKDAAAIARQKMPAQNVEVVERMAENAATPALATAARRALYPQNPVYPLADVTTRAAKAAEVQAGVAGNRAADLTGALAGPLGRQNANIGQPMSRGGSGILGFSPATLIKDIARAAADFAETAATGKAGRKIYEDPMEEILRQLGRRTAAQSRTQALTYPVIGGTLRDDY